MFLFELLLATLKQALQIHQGATKVAPHFFFSLVGGRKVGNKLWSRKVKSDSTVQTDEHINLRLYTFYNFVTNFSLLMGLETNGGKFNKKEANGQQVRMNLSSSTNWKNKKALEREEKAPLTATLPTLTHQSAL